MSKNVGVPTVRLTNLVSLKFFHTARHIYAGANDQDFLRSITIHRAKKVDNNNIIICIFCSKT